MSSIPMFWVVVILALALLVLVAVFGLLAWQRRPSLSHISRELRGMRLGEEPRQVLGRVLHGVRRILEARRVILLYYEAEEEQLYRWDCAPSEADASLSEVPSRELEFWIPLEHGVQAEMLGPEAPLSRRLEAARVLSVRLVRGKHCGRLLALDPRHARQSTLADLHALASNLALLIENFFLLHRTRSKAIDEERSRIARDFHDGPVQTFLSLDIHLEFIRKLLERDPQRAAEELQQLQLTARNQHREIRDLLQEMRPMDMDGATLLGLLRNLVDELQKTGGFSIRLLADSHRVDAPRRVCREVFQIVREAVTNARKHANPRNILITVDAQPDELTLTIDDDGKGFQFVGSYTLEELDRMRVGPVSIKQRAHQLGAFLRLESNPGLGARLLLRVPLTAPTDTAPEEGSASG